MPGPVSFTDTLFLLAITFVSVSFNTLKLTETNLDKWDCKFQKRVMCVDGKYNTIY